MDAIRSSVSIGGGPRRPSSINITLDAAEDVLMLIKKGTDWMQVAPYSNNE